MNAPLSYHSSLGHLKKQEASGLFLAQKLHIVMSSGVRAVAVCAWTKELSMKVSWHVCEKPLKAI